MSFHDSVVYGIFVRAVGYGAKQRRVEIVRA